MPAFKLRLFGVPALARGSPGLRRSLHCPQSSGAFEYLVGASVRGVKGVEVVTAAGASVPE